MRLTVVVAVLFALIGSVFFMVSCASSPGGPSHAYPTEPTLELRRILEQGCEWEAAWGGFHSTHDGRFDSCMAFVGIKHGRVRGVGTWHPPLDTANPHADTEFCAATALRKAHDLDACMLEAGFEPAPDQLIPYRRPGQSRLGTSRDQLKECAASSRFDGFDRDFGACLRERGWEWRT